VSRSLGPALRRVPLALWIVLGVGVALRVWLWVAYSPAMLNLTDTEGYIYQLEVGVFNDPVRPPGYGIFLLATGEITDRLELPMVIQNLVGIASGLLLYATVRRFGAPVWVGVLSAAAILLSVDQIFLEHALLSEAMFTGLLVASLYACARAIDAGDEPWLGPLTRRDGWLLLAGVLVAGSAWIRLIGVVLLVPFVVWAALALGASGWARVRNAVALGGAAAAILLVYMTLNLIASDRFALGEASGWGLYSRVAPFAECEGFDPPAGTEALCEETDPQARPGPDFYGWDAKSPARRLFGGQPTGDAELNTFARRAIFDQPLAYVETVGYDTLRFFVPKTPLVPDWFENRPFSGPGYEITDVDRRSPDFEQQVLDSVRIRYPDANQSVDGSLDTLGDVQELLRVHPGLMLAAVIVATAGLFVARGAARAAIWLLLSVSLFQLVVTVATTIYTARYAIPVQGPLIAAGAIGAWQLVTAYERRRQVPAPAASG
jgi:hypothetical protein